MSKEKVFLITQSVLCALVAGLLAVVSMEVFAATMYTNEVNGIKWVYTLSSGKATLGGGNSSTPAIAGNPSGKVEIPSTLGETPIVAIASYAFNGKTGIKDLTVPNSVTNSGISLFPRSPVNTVFVCFPSSFTHNSIILEPNM